MKHSVQLQTLSSHIVMLLTVYVVAIIVIGGVQAQKQEDEEKQNCRPTIFTNLPELPATGGKYTLPNQTQSSHRRADMQYLYMWRPLTQLLKTCKYQKPHIGLLPWRTITMLYNVKCIYTYVRIRMYYMYIYVSIILWLA